MNILLKKVRIKTLFSRFEPIKVEPLELCYLKTVADEMGNNSYIIDELFNNGIPTNEEGNPLSPDIIVLTGYNVAENEILKEAQNYKLEYPNVKIIIGGVHIQLNSSSFHKPYIDYVIHSQSLEVFKIILRICSGENLDVLGFDYIKNEQWIIGDKDIIFENEDIIPDRELFSNIRNQVYYLDKREVALIKGSVGCPYSCSYCYCKELNGGKYLNADYEKMVREMSSIDSKYFWIVDDVLLINNADALSFIDEVKKAKLDRKFIAYLRADFIIKHKDLIPELKEVGLNEVIIGFEAINEEELKNYNKTTSAVDYPKVISILKENDLDFTALFMVHPSYEIKDFINLSRFIKKHKIDIFTLSIFTPIKGTIGYEDEKNLIRNDPKYFDFLHLVTKSNLPKFIFYLLFYGLHLRLLKSKRIWKYILRR